MKNTTNARKALKKARESAREQRKAPLFTYRKWSIVKFDQYNLKLVHENDDPRDNRFYPTLTGALKGLVKEVGRNVGNVQEAIDAYHELDAKISTLAL